MGGKVAGWATPTTPLGAEVVVIVSALAVVEPVLPLEPVVIFASDDTLKVKVEAADWPFHLPDL